MTKHTADIVSRDIKQNLGILRKTLVPGNIFSPNQASIAISIDHRDFIKLFNQVGESGVAYLSLDGKEIPTMIEEVQWHPTKDTPIHVSFRKVDLKQKTEAFIPVELVGKFDVEGAVLVTVRDEIEVRALPTDLPEKFEINVESLTHVGQSIVLADLECDRSKIEIIIGEEGEEAPVVLVQEVEEEVEELEQVDTEILTEKEEPADQEEKKQ